MVFNTVTSPVSFKTFPHKRLPENKNKHLYNIHYPCTFILEIGNANRLEIA